MKLQNDSNLKRLMLLINQAYLDCSHPVDLLSIERLAELLYQVMNARYRIFHNIEHVFNTTQGREGVAIFAALFHDVIYHQVDKRIHPLLAGQLSEFTINEKTSECILPDLQSEKYLSFAAKIFGFKSGQSLNAFSGLNEFLSAVVAARLLKDTLSEWQIIHLIACIESTIPFRPQLSQGSNSYHILRKNIDDLNIELKLNLSEEILDNSIKACVALSNQDICGFYSEDFGEFISGTWNLILENNPIFKNPLYTVGEYGKALQKLHAFFSTLKTENVVHQWSHFPNDASYLKMKNQVASNLKNAIEYLELKLIEIVILEALAINSGGDAPYFLLIGESSSSSTKAPIERFFPEKNEVANPSMNAVVYNVLKKGRNEKSSFDFNHSPLAAYLYENLSPDELKSSINLAHDFHHGKIDSNHYIKSFRSELIKPIVKGVSEISWSRKFN